MELDKPSKHERNAENEILRQAEQSDYICSLMNFYIFYKQEEELFQAEKKEEELFTSVPLYKDGDEDR